MACFHQVWQLADHVGFDGLSVTWIPYGNVSQRSGIGSSERLSSLGISTLSDLPGVGNNYTDHQIVIAATARVEGQPDDTGDAIICGDPETMEEYQTTGKGAFAWNFADGGAKLRPTSEEVRQMSPAFQEKWEEFSGYLMKYMQFSLLLTYLLH